MFYMEACYSGSMFERTNISGVYAVTAAGPYESSAGCYCGSEAVVDGKNINSCLGDTFSVNFMEDCDAEDITTETLAHQFDVVKQRTRTSTPHQWGDLSFVGDAVADYLGSSKSDRAEPTANPAASAISVQQVDLHRLFAKYQAATSSTSRLSAGAEMAAELRRQLAVDRVFARFLDLVYPGDEAKQELMRRQRGVPTFPECELGVHDAFRRHGSELADFQSGFALQFQRVVVNVCADIAARSVNVDLLGAARLACTDVTLV